MVHPIGEKEGITKKDSAETKSIEESNSNANAPPEKRRPADQHAVQQQQQKKHSTSVVAAPAPTRPTSLINPAHTAVHPHASGPTPLWKGITGMISKVSKVFGSSRDESESDVESNAGEPSKSQLQSTPALPTPTLNATATELDLRKEQELKRARHEAARAYALGLGAKERAYYASTGNVDAHAHAHAHAHVQKVNDSKPKRKVFTAPRNAQPQLQPQPKPVPQPVQQPKSDVDRHHAARAFALGGGKPAQSLHPTADSTKDVFAAGKNHPHPGIIWPPPTRLLNLKLDDFAKRAGQNAAGGITQVLPIPIPSPRKVKPAQPPHPHVQAPKAPSTAVPTGATGLGLKKEGAAAAAAAAAAVPPQPAKKRKYKHGGTTVATEKEKEPVRRPSLTVTSTVYNKEYPVKSTIIASTGAAVIGTGNGVALAPPISTPRTSDEAPPVFPTTLKTQVMSAASTVARSLNLGPWPSPHLSLDGHAVGAVDSRSATKPSASSLHSQHMSVVAASIQQFAYDVILRSMELEIPEKANESKAFLGTMLILREVLTQNGEEIFGSVTSLIDDDDSKDSSWEDEVNKEAKVLSHQVLATSVILAGLEAFQGLWSEKLSTDFLCMIDGYDNDSDEVAEYMVAVDQNTAVTLSGGREMSVEERLAWQLSTNLHRDDHPVIKRKREIENAETSWKARKVEVASPNACHISILEEALRD